MMITDAECHRLLARAMRLPATPRVLLDMDEKLAAALVALLNGWVRETALGRSIMELCNGDSLRGAMILLHMSQYGLIDLDMNETTFSVSPGKTEGTE